VAEAGFDKARVVEFLTAVGEPVRLEIVILLAKGGRMNVGQISARFEQSRPAISHHLKVLKTAGILTSKKEGQEVFYNLDRDAISSRFRSLADQVQNPAPYREESA